MKAVHLFMSTSFQPVHGFQNPVLPFLHFLYSRSPPGWNHPEAFLSNRSHSQGQRLSFRQLQAGLGMKMPCAQTPPLVSLSPTTLRKPSSNHPPSPQQEDGDHSAPLGSAGRSQGGDDSYGDTPVCEAAATESLITPVQR